MFCQILFAKNKNYLIWKNSKKLEIHKPIHRSLRMNLSDQKNILYVAFREIQTKPYLMIKVIESFVRKSGIEFIYLIDPHLNEIERLYDISPYTNEAVTSLINECLKIYQSNRMDQKNRQKPSIISLGEKLVQQQDSRERNIPLVMEPGINKSRVNLISESKIHIKENKIYDVKPSEYCKSPDIQNKIVFTNIKIIKNKENQKERSKSPTIRLI